VFECTIFILPTLAPFFRRCLSPATNRGAVVGVRDLWAASWCVRSARWVFGRIGDWSAQIHLPGHILVMGASPRGRLLPTRVDRLGRPRDAGAAAPHSGLALGGDTAARTYVRACARQRRANATSSPTTATLGFFCRRVISACPRLHRRGNLQGWGWRLPLPVSVSAGFSVFMPES